MTDEELFIIIDEGIDNFKKNEGYQKRIKVDKRPQSDWLVFNWRQLTWKENGLEYLIEIFPHFDEHEMISAWTLYSAVFYDLNNKRYYQKNNLADKTTLEYIANNILHLLVSSYKHIISIPRNKIPFAVDLN